MANGAGGFDPEDFVRLGQAALDRVRASRKLLIGTRSTQSPDVPSEQVTSHSHSTVGWVESAKPNGVAARHCWASRTQPNLQLCLVNS